jgi:8-oxo-dGTP diphosphatase
MSQSSQLATLCYVRKAGKTLFLHRNKRSDDVHYGKWNGLGGKFNPGESPEDCVKREIREESGLEIFMPKLSGILTFPDFSHGKDWYVFVFTADTFSGTLTESTEGTLSWVPDEEVLKLSLWEGDQVFLPLLYQGRFFSGRFRYQDGVLKEHEIVTYHNDP